MDESSSNLPISYLLGSVPAVVEDDKSSSLLENIPEADLKVFPPSNSIGRGHGYQSLENLTEGDGQQATSNWKGVFSISSYTQYFDVDTDIVLNRVMSSLHPISGNFFSKIEANPDLYGLMWISTTLVFLSATLGNFSNYLMHKRNSNTTWFFDVGYVSLAAWSIYGYTVLVPLSFYFLLQYLGLTTSLICFWCMWGYSLSLLVFGSILMVIPVEVIRWLIIILVGAASACFVASNLRAYISGNDVMLVVVASFVLQMGFALFIKIEFFP